jgi:large subunit ribosomal protein L22
MAKQKNPRRVGDKEARAKLRMIRISPQKLNLVAELIRGKKVETALADLEFSHKRISGDVKKVLNSAIANAENNHGLDVDSLIVSEAYVGKNFVMKRFRARARGRGARILKPFSELTIIVKEVDEAEVAAQAEKKAAKAAKKAAYKTPAKKSEDA